MWLINALYGIKAKLGLASRNRTGLLPWGPDVLVFYTGLYSYVHASLPMCPGTPSTITVGHSHHGAHRDARSAIELTEINISAP